jgi:colanic acid/amylovoran biosynthesis protein
MNKVFLDIYLACNLGDDLFLDVFAKRYPSTQVTVNYPGNSYENFLSSFPNVQSIQYTLLLRVMRNLKLYDRLADYEYFAKKNDALVFLGGSIFRDEPYNDELYQQRIKLIKAFKKHGKKVHVIGANFGPIRSEKFVEEHRYLFSLCDDVCFRDTFSYELFKDLKCVSLAPDIIFSLPHKVTKKESNTVSISVIDFNHVPSIANLQADYISKMTALVKHLVQSGFQCKLYSFCDGEGDQETIGDILTSLDVQIKSAVQVFKYVGDLEDTLKSFSSSEFVVGARFHACILSQVFEQGLLPIIYSNKTLHMLDDLGLSSQIVEGRYIEKFEPEIDIDAVRVNKVNLAEVKNNALDHFKYLDEYLK